MATIRDTISSLVHFLNSICWKWMDFDLYSQQNPQMSHQAIFVFFFLLAITYGEYWHLKPHRTVLPSHLCYYSHLALPLLRPPFRYLVVVSPLWSFPIGQHIAQQQSTMTLQHWEKPAREKNNYSLEHAFGWHFNPSSIYNVNLWTRSCRWKFLLTFLRIIFLERRPSWKWPR